MWEMRGKKLTQKLATRWLIFGSCALALGLIINLIGSNIVENLNNSCNYGCTNRQGSWQFDVQVLGAVIMYLGGLLLVVSMVANILLYIRRDQKKKKPSNS